MLRYFYFVKGAKWAVGWFFAVMLWARLEALPSLPSRLLNNDDHYFSYFYQPPFSSYYHAIHESILNSAEPYSYSDERPYYTVAPSLNEAQTYFYGQGLLLHEEDSYDGGAPYYAAAMFPYYSQPHAQLDELNIDHPLFYNNKLPASDSPSTHFVPDPETNDDAEPFYHNKLPPSNSNSPSTHFVPGPETNDDAEPFYHNKLPPSNSNSPSTHFVFGPESSNDAEASAPPVIPHPFEDEDETVSSQQYSKDVLSYANKIFSFNPQFQEPIV